MPLPNDHLVRGNAYADGADRGGWFVASFIDAGFGLRCRNGRRGLEPAPGDFELKLKRHPAGEMERGLFPANRTATTCSILFGGGPFEVYFCRGRDWEHVILQQEGDYALWGPTVGHLWIARGDSTIFTVRVPAIPRDQVQTPLADVPTALLHLLDPEEWQQREDARLPA
jgi:hypothetical protein